MMTGSWRCRQMLWFILVKVQKYYLMGNRRLIHTRMLLFLFSPLWSQFCLSGPALSCSSCHHTSTHATWKRAPWAAVVTFPVTPCWEADLFSAAQDTTTTTTLHPSLPQLSWRFSTVQAETWHLSYACIWAPLGLYLSQWLETAVALLPLHYTEQLFILLVLPRTRCSFWPLSSFFVIPARTLHLPLSGNY